MQPAYLRLHQQSCKDPCERMAQGSAQLFEKSPSGTTIDVLVSVSIS